MTSLRVITPPTVEPVSIETLKAHLRIDHNLDDALLSIYLTSAREKGEELSRRAFLTQTLEMTVDDFSSPLALLRPPLQSVTSVKYYDEDGTEATWTDYVVDSHSEPGKVLFNSNPSASLQETGGVVVRYVAGYGSTPAALPNVFVQGVLLLTAYWYENREMMNVPMDIKQLFLSQRGSWF